VVRALLAAGANISKPEHPLEGAEHLLQIINSYAPS
jgi:hypothetical protein